jgi:AhpD family alkylhydroperoxidase
VKTLESQLQIFNDYLEQRDKNQRTMPALTTAKNALTDEAYREGVLSTRIKRLMALAVSLRVGCTVCIVGQTKFALDAGATTDEIMETISVATALGGTPALAESGRVIKLLEELGKL